MTDLRHADDDVLRSLAAEAQRRIDERSAAYAPGVRVDEVARDADIARWTRGRDAFQEELARRVRIRRQVAGLDRPTGEPEPPKPECVVCEARDAQPRPAALRAGAIRLRRGAEILGGAHALAALAAMPPLERQAFVAEGYRIGNRIKHEEHQDARRKERQRARAARRRNR